MLTYASRSPDLRVAYVGITRARQLLGLAIPATDQERVLAFLQHHAIPTEMR
jgi:hypothetical protein